MKNYYYILGVKNTASDEEIRTAYKKLTFLLHPDRNGGDAFFEERFKEIQEAYATLSSITKREAYDLELADFIRPKGANTINTISPSILQFEASKRAIQEGEVLTLVWKAIHADTVHIDPLGIVEASGTKTIRLAGIVGKPRMQLTLTASNTFIQKSMQKQITIQNKSYKATELNANIAQHQAPSYTAPIYATKNYQPKNKDSNEDLILLDKKHKKHNAKTKNNTFKLAKNNIITIIIVIITIIMIIVLGIIVWQLNSGK